ncbi:unnamed protein product [Rotaria sp. Silwood2]|nr:unnamed protein product [Rotaria sp. Silwood2]CAF4593267.1 unnamed protein product [Rotaria sp. Silwood2]
MSKSNFENYYKNILILNKQQINLLRLSNPFILDIIFLPPRITLKFVRLQTLILDKINIKYLDKIFDYLLFGSNFHSLILSPVDYIDSLNHQVPLSAYLIKYDRSSIECFIIHDLLPFDSLNYFLLSCLPRLQYLKNHYLILYFELKNYVFFLTSTLLTTKFR